MNMVEKYKDVTIGERKFRIQKFDALSGGYILFKVGGILGPVVKKLDLKKLGDIGNLKEIKNPAEVDLDNLDDLMSFASDILSELGNIPENDFKYLQEKSLRVCYELLPAGATPVLNEDKTFGVIGLEDDTMTVLSLMVHSLMFNLKGFFSGSPLASMAGGLLTTFRRG